ncbi:hypothetical protein WJX79_003385 [Trebouxia sp. C0005]
MQVAASVSFAPEKLLVRTKLGSATHHPKRSGVRPLTAAWSGFSSSKPPEPVWVETHRGVPNVAVVKPENPCKVCLGKGKVTCGTCEGKGRTNGLQYRMLPSGMWPTWCKSCRGSGLWYCQRCMGTGVKRDPIGFRLPHEASDSDED